MSGTNDSQELFAKCTILTVAYIAVRTVVFDKGESVRYVFFVITIQRQHHTHPMFVLYNLKTSTYITTRTSSYSTSTIRYKFRKVTYSRVVEKKRYALKRMREKKIHVIISKDRTLRGGNSGCPSEASISHYHTGEERGKKQQEWQIKRK